MSDEAAAQAAPPASPDEATTTPGPMRDLGPIVLGKEYIDTAFSQKGVATALQAREGGEAMVLLEWMNQKNEISGELAPISRLRQADGTSLEIDETAPEQPAIIGTRQVDMLLGQEGLVTGYAFHLDGSDRARLHWQDGKGDVRSHWFDMCRLRTA